MTVELPYVPAGAFANNGHRHIDEDLWAGTATELRPDAGVQTGQDTDRRPWRPIDLEPVLAGTYRPLQPTVGRRNDGVSLFYAGRVHTIASESEAGKTWFALIAAAAELAAGKGVLYLAFEDDEGGVVGRLLALGVPAASLRERFAYLRPDRPLGQGTNTLDLLAVVNDSTPTLAVVDGVTEAMALHRLDPNDNADVAQFASVLPRRIAARGAAVVLLDHVPKDRENRGRYAVGGQHKLAGLNGAAYVLDNRQPFGLGITGRSTVRLAKDRPGQLRRHALPSGEGLHWFADLVIDSKSDGSVLADLWPAGERETAAAGFRPTGVMAKVSGILASHPGGLSKDAIETATGGKAKVVRLALELLVAEDFVAVNKGPRGAHIHTLVKDFEEGADTDD